MKPRIVVGIEVTEREVDGEIEREFNVEMVAPELSGSETKELDQTQLNEVDLLQASHDLLMLASQQVLDERSFIAVALDTTITLLEELARRPWFRVVDSEGDTVN